MTLGSLWQLLALKTRWWMAGGTVCVLAGSGLGLLQFSTFLGDGRSDPLLLLPSLVLSLGGGYAVLFPGISVSRQGVKLYRDWRHHPPAAKVLWVLSLAVAIGGLAACILSGLANPLLPGQLVWLFTGIYLVLAGWSSALLGQAAVVRAKAPSMAGDPAGATAPGR
ncbi:hypothetical protein [Pseudarthrobacter sp. NKDBFgelt]|uniref:hypothetical protein n=1 Tax=Pseudarthrobacter sp. NKDBFgelt TaxID=3384443 RepID=UPI0038D44E21